jgi:hypothetical protein
MAVKQKSKISKGWHIYRKRVCSPHTKPRRDGIVGLPKPIGQLNFNPKWQSVIYCLNQDLQDLRIYRIGLCLKLFYSTPKSKIPKGWHVYRKRAYTPTHPTPKGWHSWVTNAIPPDKFYHKWGSVINCLNLEDLAKYFPKGEFIMSPLQGFLNVEILIPIIMSSLQD